MNKNYQGSEEEMRELTNQVLATCENYQKNYNALTKLVTQIKSGIFEGQVADTFVQKYEEKQGMFTAVTNTVNEAYEFLQKQTNDFVELVTGLDDKMN